MWISIIHRSGEVDTVDIATIIGMIASFALMVFGIVSGDMGAAAIPHFLDPPSALITFGGAFGCTLASYHLPDFIESIKTIVLIFKVPQLDTVGTIRQIIDLSNVARKEGLLALEESANTLEDPFMKKGILLIVDGTDPELVRGILESELVNIDARHQSHIGFWKASSNGSCLGYDWYIDWTGTYAGQHGSGQDWPEHGGCVDYNILWICIGELVMFTGHHQAYYVE